MIIVLVTVTHDSADVLPGFLRSFHAARDRSAHDLRLVVVDSGSTDATCDLAAAGGPGVELARLEGNLGVATGNNVGIRRARDLSAAYVILANNDTEFAPDVIDRLLATMSGSGMRVASPLVVFGSDPSAVWYAGGRIAAYRGFGTTHEAFLSPASTVSPLPVTTGYSPTCFLVVAATVFDEVGLMDESFFVYCDDVDFCRRLSAAGIAIWLVAGQRITHFASSLTGGMTSDFGTRHDTRNRVLLARKSGPLLTGWTVSYLVAYFCVTLVRRQLGLRRFRIALRACLEGCRLDVRRVPVLADAP